MEKEKDKSKLYYYLVFLSDFVADYLLHVYFRFIFSCNFSRHLLMSYHGQPLHPNSASLPL